MKKCSLILVLLSFTFCATKIIATSTESSGTCHFSQALQNYQDQNSDSGLQECLSTFALCENIICKKIKNQSNAICICPVYHGKNLGTTSCLDRQQAKETHSVYSLYSPRHLLAKPSSKDESVFQNHLYFPLDICTNNSGASSQYADCFNIKCSLNDENKQAECTCPVITTTKSFIAESPNCKTNEQRCAFLASNSEFALNGAPTLIGLIIINEGLDMYNKHLSPQYFCQ